MTTLLVVNDDPVQSHLLCTLLEETDRKILKAHGTADAVRLLAKQPDIDALIVNLDMQRLDGWRLCRFLRASQDPIFRDVPLLLLSAGIVPEDAGHVLTEVRGNAFLPLPIDPSQLHRCVRDLLNNRLPQVLPRMFIIDGPDSYVSGWRRVFEFHRWIVHTIRTDQDPQQLLGELAPDLVILSLDPSTPSRWEMVKMMKRVCPAATIVVVVPEKSERAVAGEAFHHGADGCVSMPLDPARLFDVCEHLRTDARLVQVGRRVEARSQLVRDFQESRENAGLLSGQFRESRNLEAIGRRAEAVAHDVNKILTAILAQTSRLDQVSCSESKPSPNRVIAQAARRGQELASQLLGEGAEKESRDGPIDLHVLIREVLNLFHHDEMHGVKILTELEATTPYGQGDPCQVHQVLLNVIVNGWEAMPHGGTLTIRTSTEWLENAEWAEHSNQTVQPGFYVHISVTDTGTGIPPELQEKVFEPNVTFKPNGTGMGLATVAEIVRGQGGLIRMTSEVNHGTTIHVYWPSVLSPLSPSQHHAPVDVEGHCRILVVENEPVVAMAMEELLQSLGYQVLLAGNGKEAVDLYRQQRQEIDVVLLDMVMPEMGGRECFEALQHINPEVKVLLSTGNPHSQAVQELLQMGVEGIVTKPFDLEHFSRAIASVIHRPVLKGV